MGRRGTGGSDRGVEYATFNDGDLIVKFRVWCEEYGQDADDARMVDAVDAEAAAEKWAEDQDSRSADYSIVGGQPATVKVQEATGHADSPVQEFVVHGESVPHYSARPVASPAGGGVAP